MGALQSIYLFIFASSHGSCKSSCWVMYDSIYFKPSHWNIWVAKQRHARSMSTCIKASQIRQPRLALLRFTLAACGTR
jgi:hypothetical protein